MFSLRQITVGGFFGVFPGCFLLSYNFARLPYMRGAMIGVAFGALTQVVMMLLYLLITAVIGQSFEDVLYQQQKTRIIFVISILVLQAISALGCRIMGKYFLYDESDMSRYDRAAIEARVRDLDKIKPSVVHDLVVQFETHPFKPAQNLSWAHVFLSTLLTAIVTFLWIRAVVLSFDPLWLEGASMDFFWGLDLFLNLLSPFILLLGGGFFYLFILYRRAIRRN